MSAASRSRLALRASCLVALAAGSPATSPTVAADDGAMGRHGDVGQGDGAAQAIGADGGSRSLDASAPPARRGARAPRRGSDAGSQEPPAPPPSWQGFTPTGPGYTVTFTPSRERGAWQGWGASLAWWAQGVGGSRHESLYADLFFTLRGATLLGRALPGLGLTIVRYNVGGGGRPGDIAGVTENVPRDLPWFKDIDGFEVDWSHHADPASASWDFARDPWQRSMLAAALARGVDRVELFANAPMWWMTAEKSSAGGRLQRWNRRDFANYLATVAAHARARWGVTALSVEPFNEPTAGWWNYPGGQEGCNLDVEAQAEVLAALREALDARGLRDVTLAASDENSPGDALRTLGALGAMPVTVRGGATHAAALVERLNVHGYAGIAPCRDNDARAALRAAAGGRAVWMSEYGDADGSGMALAQSITEDLTHLRPSAWIYWQPAEPYSAWGLVNGSYADARDQPDRGAPAWIYTKYYVFAQFTRFVRPGAVLLDNGDHNTVAALGPGRQLAVVTVNYGNAQEIRYDLSAFARHGDVARVTYTQTNGAHVFARFDVPIADHVLTIPAEANAVYSLLVEDVTR
jgi:galactan endo-1,6-beta-galactosidase